MSTPILSKRFEWPFTLGLCMLLAGALLVGLFSCSGGAAASSDVAVPGRPAQPAQPEAALKPRKPLPPEAVLFNLRPKQFDVDNCFERENARGLVRLKWLVNRGGTATEARVEKNTVGQKAVTSCLLDVVRSLRFETQPTPTRASWTFVRGLVGDKEAHARAARRQKGAAQSGRDTGVVIDKSSPGRLPVSAIENVTEYGYRLYAFCMRDGIYRDAGLSGRVLFRFTVDPSGRVEDLRDAGSDLPDHAVIDCVAEAFYSLAFPSPEGGELRLRYTIVLNEDD